jgi:drug/metabolite transporter (DMT)-like permease
MRARVVVALLAASFGWGLAGVGTRTAYLDGATTMLVFLARTIVATIAVVLFVVAVHRGTTAAAWKHGALIGIPRIGLAPLFFMASLQYISAGIESLVITLIPATTASLAALFIGERLRRPQIAGLALGLAGTLLIILSGESGIGAGGNALAGGALALGGVVFGSASGVLARWFAPHHGTATLALPMFVSGALVAVAAAWFVGVGETGDLDSSTWVLLVALGLGSTLLPFVGTLFASKHTTAAVVALTGYLAPLVGVIGGVILLDERLTPVIVAGGALTLAGVALVGRGRRVAAKR